LQHFLLLRHTLLRDGDVITAGKTGIRVQALA
jgi:hypothetical protein